MRTCLALAWKTLPPCSKPFQQYCPISSFVPSFNLAYPKDTSQKSLLYYRETAPIVAETLLQMVDDCKFTSPNSLPHIHAANLPNLLKSQKDGKWIDLFDTAKPLWPPLESRHNSEQCKDVGPVLKRLLDTFRT
ncbi:LOW QUALITY PROTEIN: hypothetical protein AJ79_08922 [Helicocarpus griseus UAMH5409]|uniref:Uncharacterized protein n=1 Tax=Helicocarpus griseus UAMH5409 TaxID=1447875 RepID=A0A2B7WNF2_9EURO|nr:LOW QUALITY PROTEIN: hypothetical protein AJ79_08922 [Helicocarpus griseus UAMH5409]